jgi:hypothetical protein
VFGNHRQLCPFVTQAELIDRMHGDLRRLRTGLRARIVNRCDEFAVRVAVRWITETLASLARAGVTADELQLLVHEWQLHRGRFFRPEDADVIVVDG